MSKILIAVILFLLITVALFSADTMESTLSLNIQAAYYLGSQFGYNTEGTFAPPIYEVLELTSSYPGLDPGREIGTTWGGAEVKTVLNYSFKFPFLVRDGVLFKDNNVTLNFAGELSPVSVNALAKVAVSPIAILNFALGAKAGSGWAIGFNGLGKNIPGVNYDDAQQEPFSGMVYELFTTATFQFDVGAIVEGDWTHVVVVIEPKIMYIGFTNAGLDEAWVWEADEGMNFNGFLYKGTYFLGYQMPLVLDTVGILLETTQYIDTHNVERSTSSVADWNSAFIQMRIGPLFNIRFSETMSLAILPQFKYDRKYTDETIGNRYFEYREFESGFFYFDRIALSYSLIF